jgi:hypothetical protein
LWILGLFEDEDARLAEERDCAKEELIVSFCDGVEVEGEVEVEEEAVFWNVVLDLMVALERRSVLAEGGASYDEEVDAEMKAEVEEEEEEEAGRWQGAEVEEEVGKG